jgi:Flp pilus assembly protein TadG
MSSAKFRQRERGVTIPLVALFIVVLFAMAALAVDLGIVYTARTSAQHAADAAALAGAWTFMNPSPTPGAAVVTAQQAATTVAAQNKIMGQAVTIDASNVAVDAATQRVTVTVPRTGVNGITTFFARAIGWNSVNVSVKATAEAGTSGTSSQCLKPMFIPNTFTSPLDPAPANDLGQVLFDSSGQVTPYAQALIAAGGQYSVQSAKTTDPLKPGQFYPVDFGGGSATYRNTFGECLNYSGISVSAAQAFCGGTLNTADQKNNQTRKGITDLIGNPPNFQWQSAGQYLNTNDSLVYDTAPNVIVAPVWDGISTSTTTFPIIGYVQLFIDGYDDPSKSVLVHLINATPCAPGGGSGLASGPLGVPVRLIKTQ